MMKTRCFLFSLLTALSSSAATIPTNGLALWFRADAGIVEADGRVSQWADQSGNNRTAAQSNEASRPVLATNAINTLPALRFDGQNFLTFSLDVNNLAEMAIIMVSAAGPGNAPGQSGAGHAALFWNETTQWGTVYLSPFTNLVSYRFGTTQTGNMPVYARTNTMNDFTITRSQKGTNGDLLFINGTQVSASPARPATAGCLATGNIGRGYNNDTFFFGSIAEIIVYTNVFSQAMAADVESYLTNKYFVEPTPPEPEPTSTTRRVIFAWSPNPEPDILTYVLRVGTNANNMNLFSYTGSGSATGIVVQVPGFSEPVPPNYTNLPVVTTAWTVWPHYTYWTVTAVNTAGLESVPSVILGHVSRGYDPPPPGPPTNLRISVMSLLSP